MSIHSLLIFILFFAGLYASTTSESKVVNSCGSSKYKTSTDMPKSKEDCNDGDEPNCRFVTIKKDNDEKKFCAIIHGKYNDKDILDEVKEIIKADDISVE